ncbi:MAG TPA: ABC transporter substrate-binding protein [Candidatus Nitrosotenuis sp.]|jgi:NitT/TauT family transport system substrate-binding protein|nr:ABC transporter substrate-binding protein [Candidatus Nitrosotenuis sp.]
MKILVLTGAVAAALIIIGIVAFSTQTETNQGKIRVAFFANISHAVPIIGTERGEFSRELGDVQIETKIVDSGPQAIEALFANSVDIAYVGPVPFVNGYIKSGEQGIKILAGAAHNGASFIVQKDSTISSAADLAGKKIAAPFIGNTQDVSLRNYLTENNLKPAEKGGNVIIYNIENAEIFTLFAKGDIDAAWVPEPTATILVEQLGGKRLFKEEEIWPEKKFSSVLLVARSDFVRDHPDWIERWLVAHENTIQWINQNPSQTEATFIEFYKKHTGKSLDAKIIHEAFSNIVITSDPHPNSIHIFAERAYSLGYLGHSGYNLDDMFYGEAQWQS